MGLDIERIWPELRHMMRYGYWFRCGVLWKQLTMFMGYCFLLGWVIIACRFCLVRCMAVVAGVVKSFT